jgi:hypothetical protein
MRNRRRIDAVPIFRNFSLRLFEREAARADFRVQVVLYFAIGMRSPSGMEVSSGSGQRFLGPVGLPPSSNGMKWSYSKFFSVESE